MAWLWRFLLVGGVGAVLYIAWLLVEANSTPVVVSYAIGELPEAPLWLALATAAGCSAGVLGLLLAFQALKLSLMRRRFRKQVTELESELHQLRNLPLAREPISGEGGSSPEASASGDAFPLPGA
jgi:hypothetical protein